MGLIKKIPLGFWLLQIPFIYLAYQYFLRDSLEVYDASSHLAQITYLKEFLWPNFSGFNHLNLLGFDQGLLYPSLFHYLAATLAIFIGAVLATKILIITALVLLPLSLYLFSSTIFVSKNARIFCSGFLLVTLVALPGYFGANIKGLFQVGLLPSFVSLPIVFFYLWSLLKLKSNWLCSAVLLTIVLLTHLVAGIFCLLIYASFIVSKLLLKKFELSILKQGLLAFGLAGFFLIPFIFSYFLISQSAHLASLFLPNLIVGAILVLLALSFWRTKKEKLYSLTIAAALLGLAVIVDALVLRHLSTGFLFTKIYNLHLYRYQIYFYLVFVVLLLYWPAQFLFEFPRKSKIKPELVALLPLAVLLFACFIRPPFIVNKVSVNVADNNTSGRFLEMFSRSDSYPFIYSSQNKLVTEKNKPWAYGLLTDSTPNGPYLGSLIRGFDPFVKDDQKEKLIERQKLPREKLYDTLDLFGITNLLFLDPSNSISDKEINTQLLKSGVGQNLIEVPKWPIKEVSGNWDQQVEKWWFSKGKLNSLLVEGTAQGKVATGSGKVKNIKHSKDWSKFSFEVASQEKVPVLVKFTYLPGWQAYSSQEKIEIHRASPYLMLVYASGKVIFEYKKSWYQVFGLLISLTSLFVLVLLIVRSNFRHNAKR